MIKDMRVKFKTGNSFVQTSAYVLGATKEQKPKILMSSGLELDLMDGYKINKGQLSRKKIYQIARYIGRSFEIQAAAHHLNKPVRHYIMTFPPEDREVLKDSSKMKQIVQEYMKEQGMSNTQYLVVRHNNTDHPHVHIVFNPINNNLEVINESRQFKKNEKLCKELTKKYDLHFSDPRKYKVKDYSKLAKHERPKAYVRSMLETALDTARSFSELQKMLNDKRIAIELKFIGKDDEKCLQGMIFHLCLPKGRIQRYKASQLSRSLTERVIKQLIQNKNNNEEAALENEEKTESVPTHSSQQSQSLESPKSVKKKKLKAFRPRM